VTVAITFDPRAVSPQIPSSLATRSPSVGGAGLESTLDLGRSEGASESGFTERLADAVRATDAEQKRAEAASTALAEGRSDDLHGTMLSLQRADVSLRLAANVRNRAIEAYREVMRMGG
jgi:flagellar hook-basal body complex protein FliE